MLNLSLPPARPVLQDWVMRLSFMQQSVLIAAVRGPDGIHKEHISKLLCRWLRRCVLISAFDATVLTRPYDVGKPQGGSFTGPSCSATEATWQLAMTTVVAKYLRSVDELPHHFQLHFMHASEIIGYKHPDDIIASWWLSTYIALANDMHLNIETEAEMSRRLGDNEADWRAAEHTPAAHPSA